ncbi:MAG TPA: Uma2 family endonuclease [Chthonomonadaceae bacterium]|nr:Uma2 family endonuclease [Chthonomonadaceae bacterium]
MVKTEISDTTLRTDLIVKARLYARAGIPEYWVLDLNARQLHIHREPADGEYTVVTIHAENETVAFASRHDAPIALADLLPPVSA